MIGRDEAGPRVVTSEPEQVAAHRNIITQTERVAYAREHGIEALEARDAREAATAEHRPNRAERRAAARKGRG